jgi:hypothetical protein
MRIEDDPDALAVALAGLRVHDASSARVARVRARCVARMDVRSPEIPRRDKPVLWQHALCAAWRRVEPAAAAAVGALYLVAAWMSVPH